MIIFKDWQITAQRGLIARQFDNLSRRLEVVGELPEGYTWDLLVQVGNALDIITLEPMEGGVGVTLTADQLSQSGYYSVQLRGTRGEEVRHTNVESVFIPASLSGSGQWPTVPSEFIQAEQRIREIATHPPVPGENGFWMLWDPDADQYAESQLPLPESGGTSDHTQLSNRDAVDQHPMSSITGLEAALEGKQPAGDYLTDQDIDATLKEAGKAADASAVGSRLSKLSEEIVHPVQKTADMTQSVGVDENGHLWTAPTDGSSDSGGTGVTETVVGATPYEVTKDGLYIRPDVDIRVYNISDGAENLMEQFATVKTYEDAIVYGETGKTYIEATGTVDGSTPKTIAHIYGYSAEPGDYTLLIESTTNTFIQVKKRTNSNNIGMEPGTNLASGYTNSVVNFTVNEDDVASNPCNIGIAITAIKAVLPDTYTIKLVKGKYDAMPEGVHLEFQVEAGQKFSLNPFKGIVAYSDPVTNVYEAVESEGGVIEESSGTLLCFGDSLTATRYSMYPEMLTEMGMNAINFGVSGTQLRSGESPYCMCSIVDALKAGDMTAQIEGGENANYASLLSLMPTATGIVIWYGTNDYNGDCVFNGNATDTIEGALRYVLTELFTLYPKKAIYVVSPFMYTYAYGSQPENPNGTVAEMIEVMRSVCEEFAVPFIDMSRESGFNQITRMTLTSDQLHPDTTAGRERLAKFMYGKLRSMGC